MKKNKIELYEGDTKVIGIRLIGIIPEEVGALSVVMVNDLGSLREEYTVDNGRLIREGEIWQWSITDQISRSIAGRGKWQINLKTVALGWQHSEVFDFEIKKSVNLQPIATPATATVISQIFEVEFTTELIVSSAMLYNLFRGPSAYEIAVFHGFVGTEEDWIDAVEMNRIVAENAATTATTQATNAANSATQAETAATNAANSATTATTQATNAANSATAATTQATHAANSATIATTQATNAANSATQAANAAILAQSTLKERWHTFQAPHSYVAVAATGSLASQAVWTITRITVNESGSTTKAYAYNAIRNNYLTLTYS